MAKELSSESYGGSSDNIRIFTDEYFDEEEVLETLNKSLGFLQEWQTVQLTFKEMGQDSLMEIGLEE